MIWRIVDLLHAVLALFCYPLRFTSWGRARVQFERQRGPQLNRADWSFEVSSEGEFEQIRPWLEIILGRGEGIELIYSSTSVDKTVKTLASQWPNQVRLFPLPLLTHTPWILVRELTAPRLVLCRYDFFPSLLARASVAGVNSGVVWASFTYKRDRLRKAPWRWWYRFLYHVFTWVVPATSHDVAAFERLGSVQILPYSEMRVPQILKRLEARLATLQKKFPHWEEFQEALQRFPHDRRWIMGSAWPNDLAFLENAQLKDDVKAGRSVVMIVPHQLKDDWSTHLAPYGLPVHIIDETWDGTPPANGVWLIRLKGVLCELYSEAEYVYVGGGFGRSVHSVMEPFVAGSRVVCGPKVQRSTEVEMIQEVSFQGLLVLKDEADLRLAYQSMSSSERTLVGKRLEWLRHQDERLRLNLAEVEKC